MPVCSQGTMCGDHTRTCSDLSTWGHPQYRTPTTRTCSNFFTWGLGTPETYSNVCTGPPNGLFPPTEMETETEMEMETETETEMEMETDSKPDGYIVLCRSFSTNSDPDTDPCTEPNPDGYCTHFRDGSPIPINQFTRNSAVFVYMFFPF